MKFNENLKYLRKEANLTQEQLAEKLNVSRQAVTKWESGQSLPDIQNLKEMADMFGVTMDALVGEIGTKKDSILKKKIQDIGFFIFAAVIVIIMCINSLAVFIGCVAKDENVTIVSYIVLGIIGFLLLINFIKGYLQDTSKPIINMKENLDAKKERKVYIFSKYKIYFVSNIFWALIMNLPNETININDSLINFVETLIMFTILTIFLAVKDYSNLEKKVKKLNKE